MFILTFSRIKIVFGIIVINLLVQCLYYAFSYNMITTIQQYVSLIKPEPKSHANFFNNQTMVDNKNQINALKDDYVNLVDLKLCPQIPALNNEKFNLLKPNQNNLKDVALQLSRLKILEGGHQIPLDCKARHKIAILVPYKNRMANLCSFLLNIHPFLTRQKLDYTIFVIEQTDNNPFNRGKLMNIGYTEALKLNNFDCFFFHDVDLIPMNNNNIYSCPEQPRHMAVAVAKYRNKLPYEDYFGGVVGMSRTHFKLINGFSNIFWGWGGEDDDLWNRVNYRHLKIIRYPLEVGRYHSLTHSRQRPNSNRQIILDYGFLRYNADGLNSLDYVVKSLKILPLFTHFLVDLTEKYKR